MAIDGSSQQAFERTTELARRDLSNADRLVFDRAIHSIGGRRMAQRDAASLSTQIENAAEGKVAAAAGADPDEGGAGVFTYLGIAAVVVLYFVVKSRTQT